MNIRKGISDTFFSQKARGWHLIPAAFIVSLLVILTFQSVFQNQFVDWDDYTYVVNNSLVREPGDDYLKELFTTPVASNFHPVTVLSLRMNNNTCADCPEGISPKPFLTWNIILHLLNSILVLVLCHLLYRKNLLPALFVSLVFAVHPMHVESVAWISERKDVLYSFFFLSGLIAYIFFKTSRRWYWFLLTFILFILSCLSKATAVVFPVVLILIDFWLYDEENIPTPAGSLKKALSLQNLFKLVPFFLVSLLIGVIAFRIQNGENFLGIFNEGTGTPDVVNETGPYSLWQKFSIAGYGFFTYIFKFILPLKLSALYPLPSISELSQMPLKLLFPVSATGLIVIAVLVFYSLKRTKLLFFGTGFFFITIALVLQFIPVGIAIMANRYSYLPYIGLAFIPAAIIAELQGKARLYLSLGLLLVIGTFVFLSAKQVATWKNTETLWSNVIEKYPNTELPRRSRGKYFSKLSLSETNIAEKRLLESRALEDFGVAIASGSRHTDVYEGSGVIYASHKEYDKALDALNKAIKYDPENGSAYYNRALVLGELNLFERAIDDYGIALKLDPGKAPEIINNRSNLLLGSGRFSEAVRDLDYLITRRRDDFILYTNRAIAREQLNDLSGAADDYRRALALNPRDSISEAGLRKITGK